MPDGSFVLVHHGHMPWVIGHGRWPHGEHWLFEAALGVYMPLLKVIEEIHAAGVRAPFTLGLTPVLLEQLAHPRFRRGFREYLDERLQRAAHDARDPWFEHLARRWEHELQSYRDRFEALDGNLAAAFAEHAVAGRVELLSSLATHGYAPLLKHDASIRAQLAAGLAISEQHLGFRPGGVWLPECAFRPAGYWTPPVLHGDSRLRRGVDQLLGEQGVTHFFVDAHLVEGARSEGTVHDGHFTKVDWDEAVKYAGRGWRSVLEPHRVGTDGTMSEVVAFARHPLVSEQVWSGEVGYPGDARYLEFHKKHGDEGLRYWRVTGGDVDLGGKEFYQPDRISGAVHEHAQHFAGTVRRILADYRAATGRDGCVVAPFDAELFGHWWFEGPKWLDYVIRKAAFDQDVLELTTPGRYLDEHPVHQVSVPATSTWGHKGNFETWLNRGNDWIYVHLLELGQRMRELALKYKGGAPDATTARALAQCAREVLLAQSSDWPFIITQGTSTDYAARRVRDHVCRFHYLADAVTAGAIDLEVLGALEYIDNIFPEIDFSLFAPEG